MVCGLAPLSFALCPPTLVAVKMATPALAVARSWEALSSGTGGGFQFCSCPWGMSA